MKLFFPALLLLSAALPVAAQERLEPGEPLTREIERGGRQAFELVADAGHFVYGEADQQTVDVVVTVYDPEGRVVQRFDRPARGPEPFYFDTERGGMYGIEVTPFEEEFGRYVMRLIRTEPSARTPEDRIDQLMAAHTGDDRPGGVVSVIRGGEVSFARAYGMADLTHSIPNTPQTVFNIGSVSKQFAGIAYAMLAEQDSLSIDNDVRKYLPELPDFGPTVTLRHLLNHTSGYREVYGPLALEGRRVDGDILKREDAIAVVQRQPELQFEPGTEHLYNSTGYVLLTEIAERVTGVPYPDWMEEYVFGPLGMEDTEIEREPGDVIPNAAYSYTAATGGGYREDFESYSYYGATDVYTTVYDLAKWLRNFRTKEVGGPGAVDRMLEKSLLTNGDTLDYTLGLGVGRHRGLQRISHGGATGGYRAFLAFYPELDAGVAVLSNTGSVDVGGIAEETASLFFAEHLLPEETEADRRARGDVAVAPELLSAYAGMYDVEGSGLVEFTLDGAGLLAEVRGAPRFPLVAVSDSVFRFRFSGSEGTVRFTRSGDGRVDGGIVDHGGERPMRRVEPWTPSEAELGGYAGRYFSQEIEAFYTLSVRDGNVVLSHRRLGDVVLGTDERDRFTASWPLSEIDFERDESGGVTGFRVSNGRMRGVLFERVK